MPHPDCGLAEGRPWEFKRNTRGLNAAPAQEEPRGPRGLGLLQRHLSEPCLPHPEPSPGVGESSPGGRGCQQWLLQGGAGVCPQGAPRSAGLPPHFSACWVKQHRVQLSPTGTVRFHPLLLEELRETLNRALLGSALTPGGLASSPPCSRRCPGAPRGAHTPPHPPPRPPLDAWGRGGHGP